MHTRKKNHPAVAPQPIPVQKGGRSFFSEAFIIKAVIVFQLLMLSAEFFPDLSTNGDDAKYFIISKALAHGHGYRDIYLPDSPVQNFFPVLYPVFLTVSSLISDHPLLPKIMIAILSILTMLLVYRTLKRYRPEYALPVFILIAASSTFAHFSSILMSDMPYLFVTFGALYLFEKSREKNSVAYYAIAMAVAVLPVHVRAVGLSFCAAWAVEIFLEKKYKQALMFAGIFAVTLVIMHIVLRSNSGYISTLFQIDSYDPERGNFGVTGLFQRTIVNCLNYSMIIVPNAFSGLDFSTPEWKVIGVILTGVTLAGVIHGFTQRYRIVSIYFVFYFGLLLTHNENWSSTRFLLPLLPFLYFYFLSILEFICKIAGNRQFSDRKSRKDPLSDKQAATRRIILWSFVAVIASVNLIERMFLMDQPQITPDWRNFYSCADWVRLNTPSKAIVVSRKPELFYLRSERKGFVYPFSHDVEKVIDGMKKGGAKYVVLDNFAWTGTSARYLYPAIMSHQQFFHIVYSLRNPDTFVMEFTPQ